MVMDRYISMLRGINVGGQKKILMEELRKLFESLGYENVRTYIQSGNVIFLAPMDGEDFVRDRIQDAVRDRFGFEVAVTVRSLAEMKKVVEGIPFSQKAGDDLSKLHVVFLSEKTNKGIEQEITRARSEGEEVVIKGREIYLYLPNGYGRSKLNNNFFERKLGVSATTRNWKTVNKLLDMAR